MIVLYALFSWLSLPIVSFWYWPLSREGAPQLHQMWLSGDRNAWLMTAMQVLLVVCYIGLAWGILRTVLEPAKNRAMREEPVAARD
jgi:hypothetical protein